MDHLIKWNTENAGKPILLTGAKGVGKTYLAYEFAKTFFDTISYINFEQDCALLEKMKSATMHPVECLINHMNGSLDNQPDKQPYKHILILDEITYCPSYESFLEEEKLRVLFPKIIVISSSYLEEKTKKKWTHLTLSPLGFDEFLLALGKDWYVETIRIHYESNQPLPEIVHQELLTLHQLYMKTGGFPSVINEYLSQTSLMNQTEQHANLLGYYESRIIHQYGDGDALKMIQVLESIPRQLMKDNRKFQYKLIRKGTTHSMYKECLDTLYKNNYVHPAFRYTTEMLTQGLIHDSFEENQNFKLYYKDVGLLHSSINMKIPSTDENIMFKALLENYCAQVLISKGIPLRFWESDSIAKVDFILPIDGCLVPLEVHCSSKTRSKSFSVLKEHLNFPYGIKVSSRNFEYSKQVKYLPYYALFCT